jgi:hypothetical protein
MPEFRCPNCQKDFSSKQRLNYHLNNRKVKCTPINIEQKPNEQQQQSVEQHVEQQNDLDYVKFDEQPERETTVHDRNIDYNELFNKFTSMKKHPKKEYEPDTHNSKSSTDSYIKYIVGFGILAMLTLVTSKPKEQVYSI